MGSETKEALTNLFQKENETLEMKPLPLEEIAKMIGDSKADIVIRFGTKREKAFLGLKNGEERPSTNIKTIKKHAYLDGKIERITGDFYILRPSLEFQLGTLELYGSNEELIRNIKRIVIKVPNPKPWGENGEFYDSRTEFYPIEQDGNVIEILRIAGIDEISYSGLTAEGIRKMNYKPESIFEVSWKNKNVEHKYRFLSID